MKTTSFVGFGFWHGCQEVVEMLVIARFLWSSSNRRSLEMASTKKKISGHVIIILV